MGSKGEKISGLELTKEMSSIAEKAAKAVGVEVAGVDLIVSDDGYMVLEVNRTPQFKAFYKAKEINPAVNIIDYLEEKFTQRQKQANQ